VERKSGIGGNIFRVRRKDFHGREERFSWQGGKKIMPLFLKGERFSGLKNRIF
jgi:hypothetical protein